MYMEKPRQKQQASPSLARRTKGRTALRLSLLGMFGLPIVTALIYAGRIAAGPLRQPFLYGAIGLWVLAFVTAFLLCSPPQAAGRRF